MKNTVKKLTREDVINILKDPFQAIVVDTVGSSTYLANQGNDWCIVEEVTIEGDVQNWLIECEAQHILYYGKYEPTNDPFKLILPHFFDIWRDTYEVRQPLGGRERAVLLGLIE